MISKLCTLQFVTTNNYEQNLDKLISLIESCDEGSIILAPELAVSGYSYSDIENASLYTKKAIKKLLSLSNNKSIIVSMITKYKNNFYNSAFVLSNHKIIHKQSKHHLFILNDEKKYFTSANRSKIQLFELNGYKIGILICFELRFIDLWQRLKGADIILIPAMWGVQRKEHLNTLAKALAIANQCFVMLSNSANEEMAKGSGIISPFGVEYKDDNKELLCSNFDPKEIKKMRKYMNIGL